MANVMITGAAGFFGSALVKVFSEHDHHVLAVDRVAPDRARRRTGIESSDVTFAVADVTNGSQLQKMVREGQVDGIVHAAALTLPNEREHAEDILQTNVVGTLNVLVSASLTSDCRKFVFVSSAAVYDQQNERTLTEQDASGGNTLYGATKFAAEHLVRRSGEILGIDVGIVRPTSLYGPGETLTAARPFPTQIRSLIEYAMRGQAVRMLAPHARHDWIYVDDVADGVYRLWSEPRLGGRSFNLASGQPRRLSEVVEAVHDLYDLNIDDASDCVVDGGPDRPAVISPKRAHDELGWEPRHSLRGGLKEYKEHLEMSSSARPSSRGGQGAPGDGIAR